MYTTFVTKYSLYCILLIHCYIQGANSTLSYSISRIEGLQTADGARVQVTSPFFVINSTTGVITVNTDLEREAAVDGFHYYELTVSFKNFH